MAGRTFGLVGLAAAAAVMLGCGIGPGRAASPAQSDPWPDLAQQVFHNKPLVNGDGLISLAMPVRAADAAVVPLTVKTTLPPGDGRRMIGLTLVIDQNPSPVAARFTFGRAANITAISTRVRINDYTNVHAVAELTDGKLYVVKRFVKASGGCSAPALKDAAAAKVDLGAMRFRQFKPVHAGMSREAQIMIRHPNNSGLQMNQITHLYIPAFFVNDLTIRQGKTLVLAMKGGISISENPSIRFDYRPDGNAPFRAEAVDTKKDVFTGEWPVAGSGM